MRRTPDCTAWCASPTAAMRGRPTRAARAWHACCRHTRPRSTPARGRREAQLRRAGAPADALARRGRRLGKPEIIRAAPARPLAEDQVRVVTTPGAAVVARQRLAHVVALVAEVEAQDRATHADVGRDVYQLVAAHAEALGPERHHLHETDRAGRRYRPAIEATLDVDERHDQARWQTRRARPAWRAQVPRRARMNSSAPSAGNSVLALSRRWRYSSLPASRPRSATTSRCGIPSSSASANLTPGRASRSSYNTSIPAAVSSAYRRSLTSRTRADFCRFRDTRTT